MTGYGHKPILYDETMEGNAQTGNQYSAFAYMPGDGSVFRTKVFSVSHIWLIPFIC